MERVLNGEKRPEVGFPTHCAMKELSPDEILVRVAIGEKAYPTTRSTPGAGCPWPLS